MALDESLFRGRQIKVRNPQITALKRSSDDQFYSKTMVFISQFVNKKNMFQVKQSNVLLFNGRKKQVSDQKTKPLSWLKDL